MTPETILYDIHTYDFTVNILIGFLHEAIYLMQLRYSTG